MFVDAHKDVLIDALITRGWEEGESEQHLIPPESLWRDKPKEFYLYDAVDLEEILNKEFVEKLIMNGEL